MLINIINLNTEEVIPFRGTGEQIAQELLREFPWLAKYKKKTFEDVVSSLTNSQNYALQVVNDQDPPLKKAVKESPNGFADGLQAVGQVAGSCFAQGEYNGLAGRQIVGQNYGMATHQLGTREALDHALQAACYMSDKAPPSDADIQTAWVASEEDVWVAALKAYGIEVTEENLKLLKEISNSQLTKNEEIGPAKPQVILAATPLDEKVAHIVHEAFDNDMCMSVKLGGKHTSGMFLAHDEDTKSNWLIKPGSGRQNPAAGLAEESTSQSQREAAFYRLACILKLESYVPETRLILLDGKRMAAIKLVPWSYKKAQDLRKLDSIGTQRLFYSFLDKGELFKWAVLDYISGNVDRHGGNVLLNGMDLKLIDHGSAFSGYAFDPVHDKSTFFPWYFRVFSSLDFNKISAKDREAAVPGLTQYAEQDLRNWFIGIDPTEIEGCLLQYGVDPQPVVDRFLSLKTAAQHEPLYQAVKNAWLVGNL